MRRWRYAAMFAATVVVLAIGAVVLASVDRAEQPSTALDEIGDPRSGSGLSHATGDPSAIRPGADAYARFAAEDAEWRARHAPPVTAGRFVASAGGDWQPSPRQKLRDSVYTLVRAGRLAPAIAALESWVARNPEDAQQLLELARLLNQAGRTEESMARYRELLALRGTAATPP